MSDKLKALLARYGRLAIGIYFTIFACVFAGFYLAIVSGFQPEGVAGSMGTVGSAWLATKLSQPLRIGATLLLTPVVDAVWRRIRPQADPHADARAARDQHSAAAVEREGVDAFDNR